MKCQKQFDPWKQFIEKNQDSIAKTQEPEPECSLKTVQ